ncbi:hypothetical protein CROQUDRAFT_660425 [Cronartium quercuum f. sp. fusiforme G11]|uniref:Nucleotide exchange factor Fes1 domain-containing protein n=1 Tax=Cronartium quercuum f. sp. fusiforme G11 TaxID=708437 RepID=A0A9P6NCB8_9BASI|nr:hypothetical protein CROQUDRAFT_660425 [Cronartium quercuum f. sp. fusiforme G11]
MSTQPNQLNDLLHWAVQNTKPTNSTTIASQTSQPPLQPNNNPTQLSVIQHHEPKPIKKLDTGVLDAILGRTDAIRMKESIEILINQSISIEQRLLAGEELEELVQDLDNANDLEVLGIWPKLIKLLSDNDENETIKFHTCWICGTAVQNNPRSQLSFLKHDPIPILLDILNTSKEEDTQAKALYCLSSSLKHATESSNALESFISNSGWDTLNNLLKGPSMNLRRKTVFLINSIAMQSHQPILGSLRSNDLLKTLIHSISPTFGIPTGINGEQLPQDDDFTEKALRAITTIILQSKIDELNEEEKNDLKDLVKEIGDQFIRDHLLEGAGVAETEWDQVLERVGFVTTTATS